MPPRVLKDGWTIDHIEDLLWQVMESKGAPLELRKDFVARRKGALHDAARLQLLATWARQAHERKLYYHRENTSQSVLDELCRYAPGITLLRLCDELIVGDQHIRRREALEPATQKMESTDALQWKNIIKGRSIDFTCVSGAKLQYLRPFFSSRNKEAVKRKEGMYLMLSSLSEYVAQNDRTRIPPSFLKACAVFANELIKNTQEHATSDYQNRPYLEHTEGLIVSWDQMDEASYGADFKGHPLLHEFWQRECVTIHGGRDMGLRFLQLSFFDTGPGFASRTTGKMVEELSIEEERTALLSCLRKNATSKREAGSGNGLPDVLEELREIGGIIRIRSGRLSLFNAFRPNDERDPFEFYNWSTSPLAAAAGAVVSLLIPLRR